MFCAHEAAQVKKEALRQLVAFAHAVRFRRSDGDGAFLVRAVMDDMHPIGDAV